VNRAPHRENGDQFRIGGSNPGSTNRIAGWAPAARREGCGRSRTRRGAATSPGPASAGLSGVFAGGSGQTLETHRSHREQQGLGAGVLAEAQGPTTRRPASAKLAADVPSLDCRVIS